MKIFGFIILALGVIIAYIGITGSQHQVMAIIKGVHLSGGSGNSAKATTPLQKTQQTQKGGTTP